MNTHLKIFFFTGVPFGAVFGLFAGILDGPEKGLITALVTGVLFGAGMAYTLGKLQKEATQYSGMPGGTGPRQSATIQLDISEEEGFERCGAALAALRVRSIKEDRDRGLVEGTFRASWKGFGEKIVIKLLENETGAIDLTVSSAPLLKTTLLDYGKGKQNVDSIVKFLREP